MMKQPTVRPARAAIAAVLAFASTPLLAQEAASSAPPPIAPTQVAPPPVAVAPVVAAPAASAPTQAAPAPVMATPSPVVQPTPAPVPVIAEAAPEQGPAAVASPIERSPARSTASRAEPAAERRVAPTVITATEPLVRSTPTEAAPAETTPIIASDTAPEAGPAVTGTANANANNGLEWGLAGGALVLLGGIGLMAMRRRRVPEQHTPVAVEHVRTEPAMAAPIYTTEPVIAVPEFVAPRYEAPRTGSVIAHAHHGSLEAAAAAGSSAENPFLTRKNRLRRAHFLDRQQAPAAIAPAHVARAAAATPVQEQRRPSPVYDFGGGITQRRGFRPATT